MTHFVKYQLPVIVWASLILFVTSIPSHYLIKTGFLNIDKPVHVLVYFILGWLSRRALVHQDRYPQLRKHCLIFSFAIVLAYGIFDEFHQSFIPGRSPELLDVVADAVGGLLFFITAWYGGWKRIGENSRRRPPKFRNSRDTL